VGEEWKKEEPVRCSAGLHTTTKEELLRGVMVGNEKVVCRILREGTKAKNRTSRDEALACWVTCLEESHGIQSCKGETCRVLMDG